jgi:RimJ/RimL family protein N-acetyltransferase
MLLYGAKEELFEWAAGHLFKNKDEFNSSHQAIGVVENDKIIAAVIYTDYRPEHSIEMSIASIDKRWANRYNLRAFFKYPFIDLNVKRVQTLCSANDEGVKMFNKKLGFQPEGYHREAWHHGGDAISWSMLKPECRWLNV